MERNRKASLVYITCAAALLALLGSFFMFLGLSSDFTPSLGYFATGSLPAILLYAALTAGVVLSAFSWIYLRRTQPKPSGHEAPACTKVAGVLLMVVLLWCTGDDLLHISRTLSHWGLVLTADLFALLFIVSLACDMGPISLRKGPLAAFSSFFPPFYTATQLFLLYFDVTFATNSPIKIIYQLMYIAFMLTFTARAGLLLERKSIFPRYIFSLICAAVLGGTVSVSALLCVFTGVSGHHLSLSRILLCFGITLYAFCQLFALATENTEKEEPVLDTKEDAV